MKETKDLFFILEQNSQLIDNFKKEMFKKTVEYQKKYGFDIGSGEHSTWNNEADAFKHAFMQAFLTIKYGKTMGLIGGYLHERNGNKYYSQSKGEENMDKWNNAQGREIAKEIINEYNPTLIKMYKNSGRLDDIIAKKVMERMRAGKLITHPSDKRKYTGFAANIEDESYIPDGKIFTAEEIGKLSTEEFQKFEKYIDKQLKEFGVPYEHQAQAEVAKGSMIWVDDYKRDDGTPVKGYYRRK